MKQIIMKKENYYGVQSVEIDHADLQQKLTSSLPVAED
jgi:hypothetical protein